jgi:hydroxymethylpyrimidine pyrophosphatase-like HAD family hydrolase
MLEERVLANETRRRALAFAVQGGHFAVTQRVDGMFTTEPTDAAHADVITKFEGVHVVAPAELDCEYAMRVTLFSGEHESSAALARELEEHLARPAFLTHFPLDQLPSCRGSELSVVDVHPPCRGKAEALRYLWEERGIDPRAVVAVGDATNDLELFEAAGLGVAMEHSMPELLAVADRVIGSNDSDAIAELVAELFPQ